MKDNYTVRWHGYREIALGLILIVWIGFSFYATNVFEPEMRLKLKYEEEISGFMKEDGEIDRLKKRLEADAEALEELREEFKRTKCQIQMVVAASRAGWRKAERLMQIGAFNHCGTDHWKPEALITAP